jgi:hypothetical protein
MSVGSTNYPQPVQVNGYTCHNCTEVDEAKKHIDPAHPKSGPYGVDAKTDPTQKKPIIQFGGSLSGANASTAAAANTNSTTATAAQTTAQATAPGQSVNVLA